MQTALGRVPGSWRRLPPATARERSGESQGALCSWGGQPHGLGTLSKAGRNHPAPPGSCSCGWGWDLAGASRSCAEQQAGGASCGARRGAWQCCPVPGRCPALRRGSAGGGGGQAWAGGASSQPGPGCCPRQEQEPGHRRERGARAAPAATPSPSAPTRPGAAPTAPRAGLAVPTGHEGAHPAFAGCRRGHRLASALAAALVN